MKLADLKGKTVGVCVSGGLDSKTICCVLKDAGVKVKAFSANCEPVLAYSGGPLFAGRVFVTFHRR